MKRKMIVFLLFACLLLNGCNAWFEGSYVSVTPHYDTDKQKDILTVSSYLEVRNALEELVENVGENQVLYVDGIALTSLQPMMDIAINQIKQNHPIGAYAVDTITYEIGTSGGAAAVAVTINYTHEQAEVRRIRRVDDMNEASKLICNALKQCDAGITLRINNYKSVDYFQMVEDCAVENPDQVMEIPRVTANIYPDMGDERVVELKFGYETSRDSLRSMQMAVQSVFSAATPYVSAGESDGVKFSQMYSFLMERYVYKLETSITPTYSLLIHGVGDHKAFSTVFTALCKRAGLDCQTVTGTKNGEPWSWNMIKIDDYFAHLDLLRVHEQGEFVTMTDGEMEGYVWDYSAFPACEIPEEIQEEIPEDGTVQPTMEETAAQTDTKVTEEITGDT